MEKPNIIMIISHDTGRYLNSYGKNIDTPSLNQLAKEGIQFNNYFCSQPQCSPSRCSILTGKYGHNHGMLGLAHLGHTMNKDVKTIPSEMKHAGYDTWLFGFHHESINGSSDPEKLGYNHIRKSINHTASKVTNSFIDFLTEQKANNNDMPFYASVGFEETHLPVDHFEPDPIDTVEVPPYLPNTHGVKHDIAHFHGSVKELDLAVDRIMRALKNTGFDENTILIYTTDHGIPFPRAKGTLFDSGLETALIMRFPKNMYGKSIIKNQLLCNIDLMPTLLDLVGEDKPKDIDGRSFLPVLENDNQQIRDSFFCELTWHDKYHPMRGIRTNQYKYIRNFQDGPQVYLPLDIHQSKAGHDVRATYNKPNTEEELYDLENDPLEQKNLANDADFTYITLSLRQKVFKWMKETDDPLLFGPVPGAEAEGWKEEIAKGNVYISE